MKTITVKDSVSELPPHRSNEKIANLALGQITKEENEAALRVLQRHRVAIFIVAYNAEHHLDGVLKRIPAPLIPLFAEIAIFDDSSKDQTFDVAQKIIEQWPFENLKAYRTPFNRGYGGNQKLGFLYSIQTKIDIVILLHGDGQYAPEYIPRVLAAFDGSNVDAVFASRMIDKKQALDGGMPLYKWIGNQLLTAFENRMLSVKLSEFHTGFRAYNVSSLQKIPFVFNSDDFHFDTEIIIQAVANHWRIVEVSVPAFYGDEICHVNGMSYAYNCMKSVLKFRLVQFGLFYERNYDFGLFESDNYQFKKSTNSLHQYVISNMIANPEMRSLELGANRGILSSHIAPKVKQHVAVDLFQPDLAGDSESIALDLDGNFSSYFEPKSFDSCIALDVIEHLNAPEKFLSQTYLLLQPKSKLYISTANICYLPMRLSLLLGQFNYGKRGILDLTHKRLFSVSSFRRLLKQYGFHIEKVIGFPPPLADLVSDQWFFKLAERIHAWFSRHFPNLFAYNFLIVSTRLEDISDIFNETLAGTTATKYPNSDAN